LSRKPNHKSQLHQSIVSKADKRWVEELEKHPDQFTVHQIYQAYPDGVIDVAKVMKTLLSKSR
jgi:hypothetical protein